MQDKEDKTLAKFNKQVNHTIDMSDILAGRKPVGGKIGRRKADNQNLENDLKKGRTLRDKKFKAFDAYCNRLEEIANKHEPQTKDKKRKITIQRKSIVSPTNPNKLI